ncbi:SDR family oxidoreductase [Vibrio vulnificus]|uniref:UDP-glucose 4-epimerase family protein n=1 Tax=Vibrio vulnificus TaxID=672 RepID=UPI000CD1F2BB|nr:SDR family oxidoreductase [Vibrio vulnificus]EGR0207337.1 SDR family oxidoreductase [Vibrio vulnificus]EGR0394340.1 SDR family oxidoreductase [Vibrio vulnificus]EHD0103015.1 SDR family oxidoreductase [Vibrio vulnificus]EHD2242837.1 SDR family oxidoreductase [Vibrio vulnificus]EHH0682388.1 SDR family oxidoreductase [Vibrio vulnificus]
MSQVLVTGYTGFVGRHLLSTFEDLQNINLLGRSQPKKCSQFLKASIDSSSDYSVVLDKVSTVIHIAARVHVMNDESDDPLEEFRAVNTAGTMNLARQAAEAGVKRFIFVSSIKVNGESTTGKQAFTAQDTPSPEDPYGVSKAEAEEQLIALGKETDLEIVIIRPPLVYGEGVKANFASLMNLVSKGIPLPFGYITNNKRSLVSVDNLVDLIITCIDHPKAANQVFLVSDDHYVSTSEMVKEMAIALGKPSWQIPVPAYCYKLVGKLFDKNDVVDRLTGSLQVDISHTKDTLGWTPPQTLQEGFKKTAVAFLKSKQSSGK